MGFMNNLKLTLLLYKLWKMFVFIETVASYKQDHCLGRKNLLGTQTFA